MLSAFFSASLWVQLLVVWATVLIGAVLLLLLDSWLGKPSEFVWLIPMPTWRNIRILPAVAADLFRTRPLVAFALVGVPLVGLLAEFGAHHATYACSRLGCWIG
jgi:hypothetical protein